MFSLGLWPAIMQSISWQVRDFAQQDTMSVFLVE
jgi:ABC-type branched-subunit amino acid transport system ATPase component